MTRYKLTKDRTGRVYYSYKESDWSFKTSLFCEVGAPYQPWFKAKIEELGWVIETREIDQRPWLIDVVVSITK